MDSRQSIKAVARNYAQASRSDRMPPYLRHLDLDLEEPVAGVGRTHPLRIRQVCLAPDGVDALGSVRVEVRQPENTIGHHFNQHLTMPKILRRQHYLLPIDNI